MELDLNQKEHISERFLRDLEDAIDIVGIDICIDLLKGRYTANITTRGKFTIAEIKYCKNNYEHHFLGIAAKNPDDKANPTYGIKVAVKKALMELVMKFYVEESI